MSVTLAMCTLAVALEHVHTRAQGAQVLFLSVSLVCEASAPSPTPHAARL